MPTQEKPCRRLRITVTDETNGEIILMAAGVDTAALLIAPTAGSDNEEYHRLLVGNYETLHSLLVDTLADLLEWNHSKAAPDLGKLLQSLLVRVMEGLPVH